MCQVCELRLAMEDHISPCQNSYIKVCGFQGDELWLGINRATRLLDKRWEGNQKFPNSEFRPERHLSEEGRDIGQSYLVFGGGARYCMGQPLALMEMKVRTFVL